MALRTISYLKALFTTGKKPSQADYSDLMDSYVHKDDVATINSSVVDTAIAAYDTASKEVTVGDVDTLGDVLQVLSGFSTSDDVKALIDAAGGAPSWSQISGKPSTRPVIWDQQVISLTGFPPTVQASNGSVTLNTVNIVGYYFNTPGDKWLIVDIGMYNIPVRMVTDTGVINYMASCLRSVTIAVNPRAAIL